MKREQTTQFEKWVRGQNKTDGRQRKLKVRF